MHALGAWLRSRIGGESGHTLVELLVASLMGLVVVGGAVMVLISLARSQPATLERSAQIQEGRVQMERFVRELRQGAPVPGATANSSQLTVSTYLRSGCNGGSAPLECQVTYACAQSGSAASCTRKAGTGPARPTLTGLASASIFSYATTSTSATCSGSTTTAPSLVCLRFVFPAEGDDAITLEDGAYLRNPT